MGCELVPRCPSVLPESPRPDDPFDALARRRLLVVSGKGGVGRTTVAALLGLAIARRGKRVLVATTGHDDRLAWMLGARQLESRVIEAAPKLHVQRLDPQVCIREYGAMIVRSQRLSSAVFDNRLVRRLFRAIPGLDDFAVLGKVWHEAMRARTYDTILFDGPATGHLRYALGVPRAILGAIPEGPLVREAQAMDDALRDPEAVQAVLVALPEVWPLSELSELGVHLRERVGMEVGALVVNGAWPAHLPRLRPPTADEDPEGVVGPVVETVSEMATAGRLHAERVAQWQASPEAESCAPRYVLRVPRHWGGLTGPDHLRELLASVERGHSEAA